MTGALWISAFVGMMGLGADGLVVLFIGVGAEQIVCFRIVVPNLQKVFVLS